MVLSRVQVSGEGPGVRQPRHVERGGTRGPGSTTLRVVNRRWLFPLDRRRRFAGDVVDDPVDARHLVDDAGADAGKQVVGQACPVGGHEVFGCYGADGDGVVVGAPVAHDADALDRQQHGKDLAGGAVEVGGIDLVEEDLVAQTQGVEALAGYLAEDAHGEAWAWEGVAPDDFFGQAEDLAEFAYFVLEEVSEWFDELEAEVFGQAADVVVEFDAGAGACVAVAALDDVGVEGALCEELDGAGAASVVDDLCGVLVEDLDEAVADAFAFFLRVGDAGEVAEEGVLFVGGAEVDVEVVAEGVLDELALVEAEEAVVNKDAGELRADGLVQQRGNDGGIHATRKPAQHAVFADAGSDRLDGRFEIVGHAPVAGAAADFVEEVFDDVGTLRGVCNFGVELHAVEGEGFGAGGRLSCDAHGGEWAGGRAGQDGGLGFEVGGRIVEGDLVAVAHPDGCVLGECVQQACAVAYGHARSAKLAVVGFADGRAQQASGELHPVADAQDGDAQIKDGRVADGRARFIDTGRAAGEDDAGGLSCGDLGGGCVGADEQ